LISGSIKTAPCIYLGDPSGREPLRGPFTGTIIAFPKASSGKPFASAAA
jgi:hypothetical protein